MFAPAISRARDNIRFGRPEAKDEEIVEAAKAVGAHEFIMKLPRGYDYAIQEGSSNISIGQRQLISFARTLLMNPRLLVLDEATSSIDPYAELVVQNALKKLLHRRLAIIIAHRLSTIRLVDEIIVVDEGKTVEQGTHEQLMRARENRRTLQRVLQDAVQRRRLWTDARRHLGRDVSASGNSFYFSWKELLH